MTGGNLFVDGAIGSENGVILKSPDALTCAQLKSNNSGVLFTIVIPCP